MSNVEVFHDHPVANGQSSGSGNKSTHLGKWKGGYDERVVSQMEGDVAIGLDHIKSDTMLHEQAANQLRDRVGAKEVRFELWKRHDLLV